MRKGKPFDQSVVHHNEGAADNFLPAGDTHIICPGQTGPLSGQRFEAHRIGMEDYELLAMLKSKNRQKALEIIDIVFVAFDEYKKDVQTYRKARLALLEAVAYGL